MHIFLPNDDNSHINVPKHADGTPKLRFETKMRKRSDGTIEKAIFINGEQLDWSIDVSSLMDAAAMGPMFFRCVQRDIEKHFVESVSELIGKKTTPDDIKTAIKTGWL